MTAQGITEATPQWALSFCGPDWDQIFREHLISSPEGKVSEHRTV